MDSVAIATGEASPDYSRIRQNDSLIRRFLDVDSWIDNGPS
jgi:hypothetical protein